MLGDRRQLTQGHTLKGKHINSIIFRFPTDFPVGVQGCLSRYSPAETETRTTEQYSKAVDNNEYGDIFFRRQAFVMLSCTRVWRLLLSNEDLSHWGGLLSCLLRFMTLIWTPQSSEQEKRDGNHRLSLPPTYWIAPWMMLSALWIYGTREGKVTHQKITILGRSNDLLKHYWASDNLFMPVISCEH